MASFRKTINGALKSLGVVGGHGATATDEELYDCFDAIYGMYHQWISTGFFGRMTEWSPQKDYIAGENQRVYRSVNETQMILLPDMVSSCGRYGYRYDGFEDDNLQEYPTTDYGMLPTRTRLNDGKRAIRDLSVIVINDKMSGETDEAIYDAGQKQWFVISDLARELDLSDEHDEDYFNALMDREAPLSHRDPIGFRACVAMQIADLFRAEITPMMQKNAQRFERNLATRFSEEVREPNPWIGRRY